MNELVLAFQGVYLRNYVIGENAYIYKKDKKTLNAIICVLNTIYNKF